MRHKIPPQFKNKKTGSIYRFSEIIELFLSISITSYRLVLSRA